MIEHTCPITGEPIKRHETVSRSACARLVTLVSDLPSLMEDATYSLTTHRAGGGGGTAASKPPLSLALLEEIGEMRDAVDAWAVATRNYALRRVPG